MNGYIIYIKFSGDYDKFDEWKEIIKEVSRYMGILKYLRKELWIPSEVDVENNEHKLNIYE